MSAFQDVDIWKPDGDDLAMKKCCRCKKELDSSSFKKNARKKDGLQSQCSECQKVYRREHYLKNRQKYIDKAARWKKEFAAWLMDYKSKHPCVECGESHPACIDFHHPGEKDDEIGDLAAQGKKKKLLEELKKCIPMCANCHRKLHFNERN